MATTIEELLLETLEKLEDKEFNSFKWRLQLTRVNDDFQPIPRCQLEHASREEIVNMMVQAYTNKVLDVATEILKKMNKHGLAKDLSNRCVEIKLCPGLEDESDVEHLQEDSEAFTIQPEAAPVPPPLIDSSRYEDDQETPQHKIKIHQEKLQNDLQSKFMLVQEGMTERREEQYLDDVFIELVITSGGEIHINEQHEITQLQISKGRTTEMDKPIEPSDIFKSLTGKPKPTRTVLTIGIAGIGKTFLVNKFILDWAERKKNEDIHLIFPLTFRELNLLKGKKERQFSLVDLIHTCIFETKAISKEDLNHIFTELQESGGSNFNKSKFKVLFVLDGLDESRLQLDFNCKNTHPSDFDVKQETSVEVLLTALLKGELLPSARVWITSRPAAASLIPPNYINRMTVVRGFSEPNRVEYFTKRIKDKRQANRIISHIEASRSLFIMCHIPVFCWITAVVFQDGLKNRLKAELPTTLTQMYTEFLMYLITQAKEKYAMKKIIQYTQALAKLAFNQLEKHDQYFYETDLKDCGINYHKAALYSGMFTEVFCEVRKWKLDTSKGKTFSFIHLTFLEYMAALHVMMSLIKNNKNVLSESECSLESVFKSCKRKSITEVHNIAIDKALESPNGHWDLFLRFLLGLSLPTNQDLFKCLLKMTKVFSWTDDIQSTVESIKKRIRENPEKSINLFYCLNEMKDDSLVDVIRQYLTSGSLSTARLSPPEWSALVFILLSSEDALEVFKLKKYRASDEGLLGLLPVVKVSTTSLLNYCNLTGKSCEVLASVLSSKSSKLIHLDMSDNNLYDSGVKLLCAGLRSPDCTLQTLRLSGCLITDEGCVALASALKSNPSHLKELDLSYNHPGITGGKLLIDGLNDPNWSLKKLNLNYGGEQRLRHGLQKYACRLILDENTAHKNLKLSSKFTKVTTVKEEQPYCHHPERFDCWLQVLCTTGLTGCCYWEVDWEGKVYIAVTRNGIRRKGEGADGSLGANDHSWMLLCDDKGHYSVLYKGIAKPIPHRLCPLTSRVAVFLNGPAGTLSFYNVASDKLVHLYTFNDAFDEPVYPAFGFGFGYGTGNYGSWVSICEFKEHC